MTREVPFRDVDPAAVREALDRALANGGEFAEIYIEEHRASTLTWDDGKLDRASAGHERGVGLRVVAGELNHFANGNDVSPDGLVALADRVAAGLSDPRARRASPLELNFRSPLVPVASWPDEAPVSEQVARLAFGDQVARGVDSRVAQVTLSLGASRRTVFVANSDGVFAGEDIPLLVYSATAIAREAGELRSAHAVDSASRGWEFLDEALVEKLAADAARVARLQLEAAPAPSGAMPVVLSSSAGGTMIHEACGHGLEADFHLKRLSIYTGRLGELVASERVTVVDDGTLPGRRGSSQFDDEGQPTQRVVLIERGVLVGLLQSRSTSRRLDAKPTGNGRRESYRHLPAPRMRNTFIAPGEDDPEEIIASVADGLFVAKMGGGEVDIVSGNFVFHCSEAYRIRRGRIAEPVRGATLTGNGPAVLGSIDRVGRDLGWSVGTCRKDGQGAPVSDAQPTVRIPSLVVGGSGGASAGATRAAP